MLAVALGVAGIVGALADARTWTSISRLGTIALLVVIVARIVRNGPIRILALVTLASILASILASLFGSELLDLIGVPGIWFPFNIGVARTQYIYAFSIPLLAILIVRPLRPDMGQAHRSTRDRASPRQGDRSQGRLSTTLSSRMRTLPLVNHSAPVPVYRAAPPRRPPRSSARA